MTLKLVPDFRTRLLQSMQRMKDAYILNQANGKGAKYTGQLAEFDKTMEKIDAARRLSAKR